MALIEHGRQATRYVRARFGRREGGSAIVEYALLVALIALACLLAITLFGEATAGKYSEVADSVANAG
jgi:Flp pilus assembly pilin Flp